MLGLFITSTANAQVNVEIEFKINMGVQLISEFDPGNGDYVSVTGSLDGWTATANPLAADFIDPNIFTGIVQLENVNPGDVVEFKFTTVKPDGAGGNIVGWEGGDNKRITVTGNETDTDNNGFLDIAFPATGDAPFFNGVTFDDVFSADTEVVIELDARTAFYHIADSMGMPADVQSGDAVTAFAGVFANGPMASPNGWETWGADLATISSLELVDDGTKGDAVAGDSVFTMTVLKKAGQAKRGADLKFGVNGFDNESTFAGNHTPSVDEANPKISLVFGAMVKADGSFREGLFDPYVYIDNSATPPTASAVRRGGENDIIPVDVEVEFSVNMAVALLSGEFDPTNGDYVSVTGSLDGWTATANPLTADFIDPNIYTGIVQLENFNGGDTIEFKFTTVKSDGQGGNIVGWEGGDNKKLVVKGDEADIDNNGFIDARYPAGGSPPFFNGITFDDVFSADTNVIVEVDARAAFYHLADNASLPNDIQSGDVVSTFDGLFANGPFASPNGWETWGADLASIADLELVDDGTKGDAVAGDSVYTFTLTKKAGQAKRGVTMKYGVNGFDNESGFGGDHFVQIDEANPTYRMIFGAVREADGKFKDPLYDAYILIDNDASPSTATVVRRGGEVDTGFITDVEDAELPQQVTLNQNFPNPFNPTTTISYEITQSGKVMLQIFDLLGREVTTLVNGYLPAARHQVQFDASELASGSYIYRLQAGDQVIVKTMVLLK